MDASSADEEHTWKKPREPRRRTCDTQPSRSVSEESLADFNQENFTLPSADERYGSTSSLHSSRGSSSSYRMEDDSGTDEEFYGTYSSISRHSSLLSLTSRSSFDYDSHVSEQSTDFSAATSVEDLSAFKETMDTDALPGPSRQSDTAMMDEMMDTGRSGNNRVFAENSSTADSTEERNWRKIRKQIYPD